MKQDNLYSDKMAWWYDSLYVPEEKTVKQIKFLDSVFKKYRVKNILDIACGTGRHTIPLKKLGYRISGIDLSKNMLKIAKEKSKKESLAIPFYRGDMRNIRLRKKFDAALIMFSAFMYNTKNDEVIRTMNSVSRVLKRKGIIVIDVMNAWYLIANKGFEDVHKETMTKGNLKMINEAHHKFDSLNLVFNDKSFYRRFKNNKPLRIEKSERKLRFFTPNEFDFLFRLTGFKVLNFYGDFMKSRLSQGSSRRLIVLGIKD